MDKRNWSNDFYLDIFLLHFENLLKTIRKPWIGKTRWLFVSVPWQEISDLAADFERH